MGGTLNDPEVIRRVVSERGRIAMVGLSSDSQRESNRVARYLMQNGYEVVPINPKESEVLGQRAWPSLKEVPGPRIEVIDVFRRSDALGPVVDDAIAYGARVLWLQLGVVNEEQAERARAAGLDVVMDHCLKQETMRAEGRSPGLSP
jgi:predicted CoA-binding protein